MNWLDRIRIFRKIESALFHQSCDLCGLHSDVGHYIEYLTNSLREAMKRIKSRRHFGHIVGCLCRDSIKRHSKCAGIGPFAIFQKLIKRSYRGLKGEFLLLSLETLFLNFLKALLGGVTSLSENRKVFTIFHLYEVYNN